MNTWKHIKQTKIYQNRKWYRMLVVIVLLFIVCIPVVTGDEMRSEPDHISGQEQTLQEHGENKNYADNTTDAQTNTNSDSFAQEAGHIYQAKTDRKEETSYVLTVSNGYLQVYELPGGRLYMETGILYRLLPEQLQLEILEGKFFDSEEALLLFLESYTS